MGVIATKDTRRISFDNKFALSSAITVPKSIGDEGLLNFDDIPTESPGELVLAESNKFIEAQEETEVDYWVHRVDKLKKEHQTINKIIEIEYDKTIESTDKFYKTPKITHERIQKIKPCFDWRTKIMQCYDENPRQPLVCSTAVQAFSKCVASCRFEE